MIPTDPLNRPITRFTSNKLQLIGRYVGNNSSMIIGSQLQIKISLYEIEI